VRKVLFALLLFACSAGAAAGYPEKPIRFVIPSAAGGSPLTLASLVASSAAVSR